MAATIIYNCKRCRRGKRVEYPIPGTDGRHFRANSDGKLIPAGVWVQACGGGKPTVYDGDTELGLCPHCGRAMSYGSLKATLNPDHKCDARCTGARGPQCDCSCGGRNHGVAA